MSEKNSKQSSQVLSLNRAISAATSIDEMVGYASSSTVTAPLATSTAFMTSSYHELLENPHVEIDGLQRLQENLARLEDLHGRLQFLMRDVTGLIRRR